MVELTDRNARTCERRNRGLLRRRVRRFYRLGEIKSPRLSHDKAGGLTEGHAAARSTPCRPAMQAGANFVIIEKARRIGEVERDDCCDRVPLRD
jgi:hypothetical protein